MSVYQALQLAITFAGLFISFAMLIVAIINLINRK